MVKRIAWLLINEGPPAKIVNWSCAVEPRVKRTVNTAPLPPPVL